MQFDSFAAAVTMGGHGGCVWAAYAITSVVILVMIARPVLSTRSMQDTIQREFERKQAHEKDAS